MIDWIAANKISSFLLIDHTIGPPNHKQTMASKSPSNHKRTTAPESPPNCKQIAAPESLGGAADSSLPAKKQKHFNVSLFPDSKKWPPLDRLWDVVGNCTSETYLKSQVTTEEHIFTAPIFFDRLCLIVHGLHLDQLKIICHAIIPMRYGIAAWFEKSPMIEIFEKA